MHHFGLSETPFVVMSIVVAVLGSWTALDLFRRATANSAADRMWWLGAAAVGLGLSIWSMHFVAMLGWSPGVPVRYAPLLTLISLLLPILACGGAFALATSGRLGGWNRPATAVAMGVAICVMHYLGMAALRAAVRIDYDPGIVALSFVVAVAAAFGALWAATQGLAGWGRVSAAVAMGLGIAAMHYTGMAAMRVTVLPADGAPSEGIDRMLLAMSLGAGTLVLLLLAVIAAIFDRKFHVVAERGAEAVRQNERLLRAVYDQMPMGVLVADVPSGRIRQANAEAERLLGRQVRGIESVAQYTEFPGIGPDEAPLKPYDYPLARAVAFGERTERRHLRYRRGDGEIRWLEICSAPIHDESGAVRLAVSTFADVTEQRWTEEALLRAQRMEAVGQLTGGIAHDFNNLLTAVMGSISLVRKRVTEERSVALLENAGHAARRGAALVSQLLAFSRQQRLETQPVEVNTQLSDMRALLSSTLGGTIRVELDLDPSTPVAAADPTQLELAVLNLAINARDAMPTGGALTLHTGVEVVRSAGSAAEPGPGEYVAITVEDTGTGMPADVLARVFEPFFTTKPVGKGSGLGLSQVLGLAQQMGGGVRIGSNPGSGTKVTVLLPRARQAVDAASKERGAPAEARGHGLVLVVDDDEDVRDYMEVVLGEAGYDVVGPKDPIEAIACVRSGLCPDYLVIDYAMPELNGAQVYRQLRDAGFTGEALFVTGYSDMDALEDFEVLRKPFEPSELLTRIAALRGHGEARRLT
jgi:NO-binding membrane sensor protein with MHYT domain/nitrogen-specific signal transduction histidine kinase